MKKNSRQVVNDVLRKTNGKCWYCGVKLSTIHPLTLHPFNEFVIDHVICKKLGGTEDLKNLVPCCWNCNTRKRTYSLEEFRMRETLLLNHAPNFSPEQKSYLEKNNIALPSYPLIKFYFEKEGLS